MFIGSHEPDVLRSSGERFGQRLAEAGGTVRLLQLNQPEGPAAVRSERMAP